jgi:hypothetical protein
MRVPIGPLGGLSLVRNTARPVTAPGPHLLGLPSKVLAERDGLVLVGPLIWGITPAVLRAHPTHQTPTANTCTRTHTNSCGQQTPPHPQTPRPHTSTHLLGVHSKVLNLAQRDGLVLIGSLIWGLIALRVRPERTNLNLYPDQNSSVQCNTVQSYTTHTASYSAIQPLATQYICWRAHPMLNVCGRLQ